MKFDYNLSKKNYQKILKKKNNLFIYFLLLLGSIVFFIINFSLIIADLKSLSLIFILYLLFVFSFLKIGNIIYVKTVTNFYEKILNLVYGAYKCEMNEKEITQSIGNYQLVMPYDKIKKVYFFKNAFLIKLNSNGILYLFDKKGFSKISDYNKLLKKINKIYKKEK